MLSLLHPIWICETIIQERETILYYTVTDYSSIYLHNSISFMTIIFVNLMYHLRHNFTKKQIFFKHTLLLIISLCSCVIQKYRLTNISVSLIYYNNICPLEAIPTLAFSIYLIELKKNNSFRDSDVVHNVTSYYLIAYSIGAYLSIYFVVNN